MVVVSMPQGRRIRPKSLPLFPGLTAIPINNTDQHDPSCNDDEYLERPQTDMILLK